MWPFRRRVKKLPIPPYQDSLRAKLAAMKPVDPSEPNITVDYSDADWGVKTMATKIRSYWERHG